MITSRGLHLLQHVLVQRQISYQLLELGVLFFELAQAPQFRYAHAAILLLPAVEGLFADTMFPAHFNSRFAGLPASTYCST